MAGQAFFGILTFLIIFPQQMIYILKMPLKTTVRTDCTPVLCHARAAV
jgi:hypothetical protein